VPRERKRQLLRLDAATVIAHPHETQAPALDVDLDAGRARIEAVLDELLDEGRRTLDHLARGDLVDELTGEDADRHAGKCTVPGHSEAGQALRVSARPGRGGRAAGERAAALLFEARAVRRVLDEVAAHAARDGIGEAVLLLGAAQAAFLAGV